MFSTNLEDGREAPSKASEYKNEHITSMLVIQVCIFTNYD